MTPPAARNPATGYDPRVPSGPADPLTTPADAVAPPAAPAARGAFTWRSLLVGSAAVALICGLTPYNDFVLSDTSLAAGFLPLGAVLFQFFLIVAVNAPLHRWAPRLAFSTGELTVVLLMLLVACGIPNWGLMRFLIPTPVAYFYLGVSEPQFWQTFSNLNLPAWLFPVSDVSRGRTDPVVTWFFTARPRGEAIPWHAWVGPLAAWSVFIAAMLATVVAMARMVVHQWMVNERLPFPLAQVHSELIEPPQAGRALNSMFRSRLLWVGLLAVLLVHGLTLLNAYFPKEVPTIPLGYDLSSILGTTPVPGQPTSYLDSKVKASTVSFILVGVTYFIRSRVAFSLWGIYFIINLVSVQAAFTGRELPSAAKADQHLGASIAFLGGVFWIGRHHWARVLRNAVGRGEGGDATYRIAFWTAVAGVVVMVAWLRVVGVQWWLAGLVVAFLLAAHLIVTRVVAETGLPFYRSQLAVAQVYTTMPAGWFTGKDVFFANLFTVLGPLTTRDSVAAFAATGMGVGQSNGTFGERRRAVAVGATLAWALALGCTIAAASTLYCHYTYPTPVAREVVPAGNNFGAVYIPKRDVGDSLMAFGQGRFAPKQHDPYLHMGIGFGVMLALEVAALRWASWPLLPVGYVTSHGAFIANAWFSIFIGWLAKVLIVRFGGATVFQSMRPLFVGMIFGEALAAGSWLLVNALVVTGGGESQAVRFLP